MAGFRKAAPQQAALKMAIYGPPGSGKTLTSLLFAEGLTKMAGKRIAYVDTERGTDFYSQAVPSRGVHPAAFDFDALYTRSITEMIDAIKGLSAAEYGVVVIDSITHVWEAARAAYAGRETKVGTIPMHAWGKIKAPYKSLMAMLLSSPLHVFICGRQGVEYETDAETEELRAVGLKMKAEGETAYEPHILLRMWAEKGRKPGEAGAVYAYAEKDRTGVLAGRTFLNPTYESVCQPLLGLLGATQAKMTAGEDAAVIDADALAAEDRLKETTSRTLCDQFKARITLCSSADALKAIGKEITPDLKARMLSVDVAALREAYLEAEGIVGERRKSVSAKP